MFNQNLHVVNQHHQSPHGSHRQLPPSSAANIAGGHNAAVLVQPSSTSPLLSTNHVEDRLSPIPGGAGPGERANLRLPNISNRQSTGRDRRHHSPRNLQLPLLSETAENEQVEAAWPIIHSVVDGDSQNGARRLDKRNEVSQFTGGSGGNLRQVWSPAQLHSVAFHYQGSGTSTLSGHTWRINEVSEATC